MKHYRVLVAAGMINRKLRSKIKPILNLAEVEKVYLVRRAYFEAENVTCISPTGVFSKNKLLSEIYRVGVMLWLILTRRVDLLIGIGHVPHGMMICTLGKIFGLKSILLLMGKNDLYLTYPKDKFRQKVALRSARWATLIGTRGESSARWLEHQGIAKEKIFIPHNLFDFKDFSRQSLEKKYELIYVGLLNYYKRVDILIDVVHRLVYEGKMESLKVAIVGEGKLKDKSIRYALDKGLAKHIDFLPPGNKEYLNHLLNQSKIFVMTSQGEGLPMVIVEAMSCGLPVVVFRDADISDVARHNYNALLCELWDIEAFTNNVQLLLSDDDVYRRLSKNALKIGEEKEKEYSEENLTVIWECALKQLDAGTLLKV